MLILMVFFTFQFDTFFFLPLSVCEQYFYRISREDALLWSVRSICISKRPCISTVERIAREKHDENAVFKVEVTFRKFNLIFSHSTKLREMNFYVRGKRIQLRM